MVSDEKNYKDYTQTRFKFNPKRKIVWEEIARYLIPWISEKDVVVEIGSGYCDFINSVKARKKIAVDKYYNPKDSCARNVAPIFGGYEKLDKLLKDGEVNVFLMSNFLEHLDKQEASKCLDIIKKKLASMGRVIMIQPNYKYCQKEYFDDYTHKAVWSHDSLKDFLKSKGFKILKIMPKFLPFSMKSRLPKSRLLVRAYLNLPIKPLGKQMLIIGGKP